MNDEVEKLEAEISDIIEHRQLPKGGLSTRDMRGDHNLSSTELGLKTRKILTLFQKAQVEAVRAELEGLRKVMEDCKDCPKDEPPSIHILARLATLKEDGETK